VNLGNPEEWTVLEMAEAVRDLMGSSAPIVHEPLPVDDPKVRQPNISLARDRLGWRPVVGIREGVKTTIDDFRRRAAS
jgi:UDP-glucuronate decarboxylase